MPTKTKYHISLKSHWILNNDVVYAMNRWILKFLATCSDIWVFSHVYDHEYFYISLSSWIITINEDYLNNATSQLFYPSTLDLYVLGTWPWPWHFTLSLTLTFTLTLTFNLNLDFDFVLNYILLSIVHSWIRFKHIIDHL